MYAIKQSPADFIVEEIISLEPVAQGDTTRKYLIYRLSKSGMTTMLAMKKIAGHLGIEEKLIGYCGLKDKNATTTQYISIPNFGAKTGPGRVCEINDKSERMHVEFIGSSDIPLYLGALRGNRFTIRVTDIDGFAIQPASAMANYFGEQRFSTDNEEIGRLIIKRRFTEARDKILTTVNNDHELRAMIEYAHKNPADAIGAIRRMTPALVSLYVHAYQSALWNRIASQLAQKQPHHMDEALGVAIPRGIPVPQAIPIIGFDYEPKRYNEETGTLIAAELKKEGLSPRDFILREFPELTKTGSDRDFVAPIKDLEIQQAADGAEATFSFTLEKGCYATVALRHLLVPRD